jgi:hypothetical protein
MVFALAGSAVLGGTLAFGSLAPFLGLKALLTVPLGGSLTAVLVGAVACRRTADRAVPQGATGRG